MRRVGESNMESLPDAILTDVVLLLGGDVGSICALSSVCRRLMYAVRDVLLSMPAERRVTLVKSIYLVIRKLCNQVWCSQPRAGLPPSVGSF